MTAAWLGFVLSRDPQAHSTVHMGFGGFVRCARPGRDDGDVSDRYGPLMMCARRLCSDGVFGGVGWGGVGWVPTDGHRSGPWMCVERWCTAGAWRMALAERRGMEVNNATSATSHWTGGYIRTESREQPDVAEDADPMGTYPLIPTRHT